jgi:glycosyltransferase involved in cell wall biosynthesis
MRPEENFAVILTVIAHNDDLLLARKTLEELDCANLDILILNPFDNKNSSNLLEAQTRIKEIIESTACKSVLVLSNFEQVNEVIPIPSSGKYKRIGILYDLIPLQYPEQLLVSRWQKSTYGWALRNLSDFDLLLSISEESKKYWQLLVKSKVKIEVIHGGGNSEPHKFHKDFSARNGILCVGAEKPHKNIERLISSYLMLPVEVQIQHNLTIVGISSIGARKRLHKLAKNSYGNVIIPKYLDSANLDTLYEDRRLLVMPSIIEGLSLPILEAWSHGLVTIGSSNTVARELISSEFLLFDPFDPSSIAQKIIELLASEEEWKKALKVSISQSRIFTWDSTASLALLAIEKSHNGQT